MAPYASSAWCPPLILRCTDAGLAHPVPPYRKIECEQGDPIIQAGGTGLLLQFHQLTATRQLAVRMRLSKSLV